MSKVESNARTFMGLTRLEHDTHWHDDHRSVGEAIDHINRRHDQLMKSSEYYREQNALAANPGWDGSSSRSTDNKEWHGSDSFEDWVETYNTGWAEGRDLIREATDLINAEPEIARLYGRGEDISYDVVGAAVDMGAYMDGQPECMVQWEDSKDAAGNSTVRIYSNVAAHSGQKVKHSINRAAGIAAMIDVLESRGHYVELWVVETVILGVRSDKDGRSMSVPWHGRVRVKRSTEPLAVERIAFAAGHLSTLRRLFFALNETTEGHERWKFQNKSYGYPREISTALQELSDCEIYLPGMTDANLYNFRNAQSAAKWALATLKLTELIHDLT